MHSKLQKCFDLCYYTSLPVSECIGRITAAPFVLWYTDALRIIEENYDCQRISSTELSITFLGSQYTGPRRSRFVAIFEETSGQTKVSLQFQDDILGVFTVPLLFTATGEIDCFMQEKICATRYN